MTSGNAQARRKSTDWKVVTVNGEGRVGTKPDYVVTEEPMEFVPKGPDKSQYKSQ